MPIPIAAWAVSAAAGGALRVIVPRTAAGLFAAGAASVVIPPAIRELSFENTKSPPPPLPPPGPWVGGPGY